MMFRNELFEKTPNKPLDWNKIYPGWNSDSHKEMARQAARESIVMLEIKITYCLWLKICVRLL